MRAKCVLILGVGGVLLGAIAPATRQARPTPPTRDPHTPGYVEARELPDGTVPAADVDGNFILGPTHPRAAETAVQNSVPQGAIYTFTMNSADSKIYPGITRDAGTLGTADPADPAKMIVTTSHAGPYTRRVAVYVPKQPRAGNRGRRLSSALMGRIGRCLPCWII